MKRWITLLVAVLVSANVALFLPLWTGDAEITQVYAEHAAAGRWFEFNAGERTAGVTSPAWLLLLSMLHRLGGATFAAYGTKVLALSLLVTTALLVVRIGRAIDHPRAGVVAAALFLLDPTIAAHALTGLEGALAAAVLAAGTLNLLAPPNATWRRVGTLAATMALALLTRLEIALVLAASACVATSIDAPRVRRVDVLFAVVIAAVISLPWFLFQHRLTGHFLPTSGMSRLWLARRSGWHLGPLTLHGALLLRLCGTYAPFAVGTAIAVKSAASGARRAAVLVLATQVALVVVLDVAVIGGRGYLRYFLPCFPAYFLLGALGLAALDEARARRGGRAWSTFALAWMAIAFVTDFTLRARDLGDYVPHRAHLAAPTERSGATDALLAHLGAPAAGPVRLAVTEVEMRRALDDRVVVLSLDGRVDPALVQLVDPASGCPDVARYLVLRQADYVHAERACDCPQSVLCALERHAARPDVVPGSAVHEAGLEFVFTGWDWTWRVERGVAGPR